MAKETGGADGPAGSGYAMLYANSSKAIYITRCCLCVNSETNDGVSCGLGLPGDDGCEMFSPVSDVGAAMEKLMEKLPDGYGMARREENPAPDVTAEDADDERS